MQSMETPYIVKKGAVVAKNEMQKALSALNDVQDIALKDRPARDNLMREPIEAVWKHLHEVNEWLTAIEGRT